MNTTWRILNLDRLSENNLITKIVYECTAKKDNVSFRKIGEVELNGDADATTFIPYESLSEETVSGWLMTKLGDEAAIIENVLIEQVNTRILKAGTKKSIKGLPWKK